MRTMIFLSIAILFCVSLKAAVFTVINTNDSGPGSLRQAILDANTAGGNSTIDFNIPGPAPQIIVPTTFNSTAAPRAQVYQPLTNNNITIDATTQPGYTFGSPSVIINCSVIAAAGYSGSCFFIQGANNCTIKGIGVCNYVGTISGAGISIENTANNGAANNQITQCVLGSIPAAPPFGNTRGIIISGRYTPTGSNAVENNIIGGPGATDGNILSGNSVAGMNVQFSSSNIIENNFIGTNATGTAALGNGEGVNFIGSQPSVGQSGPCNNNILQNNVISANTDTGIVLQGNAQDNTIQNNKIGTDITGSVLLGTTSMGGVNLAGDATDACNGNIIQNNSIGGNGYGIILATNSSFNQILSNYIGTNSTGANLGNINSGIITQGSNSLPCTNNLIELNTIEFNGNGPGATDFYGVFLDGDPATPDILNAILENSIFNNNSNGIELANNSNDNQAPPTIVTATVGMPSNVVTVTATAPTLPAASDFRLEFFITMINRNPITEGQRFVGVITSVPSGETVTQTFNVPLPLITAPAFISATATNLNGLGGAPGDTSAFSSFMQAQPVMSGIVSSMSAAIINKYCIFRDPSNATIGTPSTTRIIFTVGIA